MRRESGDGRCERGERRGNIEEDAEEEIKREESSFGEAFL
jgi:hypothetical protein